MAANMIKSGKPVVVYDINEAAVTKLKVDCCAALQHSAWAYYDLNRS